MTENTQVYQFRQIVYRSCLSWPGKMFYHYPLKSYPFIGKIASHIIISETMQQNQVPELTFKR